MCQRCPQVNHKIDAPVCITGAGMVAGFGYVLVHAYEGQPYTEVLIPWLVITGLFMVVGVLVGVVISRWEQSCD